MYDKFGTSALALALSLSLATPASAQDSEDMDTIEVHQQLLTPSAGMMNDHMHDGGEFMLGLRLERQRYSGANRSDRETLTDAEVLAAGYGLRAQQMEMDMVMLDLMFAPSSDITLMVMPHYMWHRMEMVGIDPANNGMAMDMGGAVEGHAHGGLAFGDVHAHGTEGFGDTLVSASYRLARSPAFRAHATLGVWVPTGSADKRNPDDSFVHYGMQPGSGTWDVEPAVMVSGQEGPVGWGAQGSYRWRSESANASGFAFGDKLLATGWASYLLTHELGATARIEYEHEGTIEGHYNGAHGHGSPPDLQGNYGGDIVSAGFGLNWLMPLGSVHRPQLGVEMAVPLHQHVNGVQLPRDWQLSVSLAQTF